MFFVYSFLTTNVSVLIFVFILYDSTLMFSDTNDIIDLISDCLEI